MARTRTGSGATNRRAGRFAARLIFGSGADPRTVRFATAVPRAPLAACVARLGVPRVRPGAERTRGDCGIFAPGAALRRERGDRRAMARQPKGGPRRWPTPGP